LEFRVYGGQKEETGDAKSDGSDAREKGGAQGRPSPKLGEFGDREDRAESLGMRLVRRSTVAKRKGTKGGVGLAFTHINRAATTEQTGVGSSEIEKAMEESGEEIQEDVDYGAPKLR